MSGKLVVGVVVGLAIGAGLGWTIGGSSSSDGAADAQQELATVEDAREAIEEERSAAQTEVESLKRRLSTIDRELNEARTELASVKAAAEAAASVAAEPVIQDAAPEVEHAAVADASDPEQALKLGEGQSYSFPEYDEHLAAVNWTEVGEHFGAMTKLMVELFDAISNGRQPSPEAVGGIQQHNGPLVTVAMRLYNKLPGETVNGAFTHPAAVVNSLVTTLAALEMPLDASQLAALERIGNDFVAEERRRVERYNDQTLALRRMADESLLKGRLYAAAMNVLTTEQHEAIRPHGVRDRVTADLFSASLVWVGRALPIPFTDRANFAEVVAERANRELDLEAGGPREALSATVLAWAQALPDELMAREPDSLWRRGVVPLDAIDLSAAHHVVLLERLISDLDLTDEAIQGLRDHTRVMVPTLRTDGS